MLIKCLSMEDPKYTSSISFAVLYDICVQWKQVIRMFITIDNDDEDYDDEDDDDNDDDDDDDDDDNDSWILKNSQNMIWGYIF